MVLLYNNSSRKKRSYYCKESVIKPYELIAQQRYREIPNWPNDRRKPPEWLLDLIAEEKLKGGYDKRNKPCKVCFVLKSIDGGCNCD